MANSDITIFEGLCESDLLALRADAIAAIKSNLGRIETNFNAPGISATYLVTLTPEAILKAVNWALKRLDPDTYGSVVTRTRVDFM